jgi:hypothetical protein
MDRQYVGIDFHRRRSVIVRKNSDGEQLAIPMNSRSRARARLTSPVAR